MSGNKRNHGTVFITGASAGIGRELAVEFAFRAKTLVLTARRLDRLEKLREKLLEGHPQLKVVALAADLSDEGSVDLLLGRVAEQVGDVDVLVNNAGLGDSVLFDRSNWMRTRQVLRTNIFAVAQLTSALLPGMVERHRGGVLNIGSGAGAHGTVTQVCPGPVEREFDQVAGSVGGMAGAPPRFFRISAAQCAREALAGFERGDALIFPGRAYRFAMRLLPFIPVGMPRNQAAKTAARLRRTRSS